MLASRDRSTNLFDTQLMTRLCETIVKSLLEFLGSTISVMSPAALATLFLEMNFIEGIIPDCLKTEDFDNRINDCYELLLTQLLRHLQNRMPSSKTEFGKVRAHVACGAACLQCPVHSMRVEICEPSCTTW